MASSITLHAFVATWFLSAVMPMEMMPQQMIKVTLVAAPTADITEQKPKPLPQTMPQPTKAVEPVKPPILRKESTRAMHKIETVQAPPLPLKEQQLTALSPSAGNVSTAQASAQMVITAPLFDAAYLNNPAPEYPAHAKRRNMEGTVMLDVAVSQDGEVHSVRIFESSGFAMLDESARNAVSRWKFVPAKRGEETLEARVMVPIEFRLE